MLSEIFDFRRDFISFDSVKVISSVAKVTGAVRPERLTFSDKSYRNNGPIDVAFNIVLT